MHQIGDAQHQVGVVVIPLPAQGHLNQLLQLSHLLITTYRLPVHYLCSATHIRQAKTRAHFGSPEPPNPTNTTTNIQFHDLQFLPFTSPPPDHPNHPNNGSNTKFPTHLQSILQSIYFLRHPISQFLRSISSKFKRLIVIHDSMMASVVEDVKSIQNAESYTFHTSSAFTIFFTMWELMVEKPFKLDLNDIPIGVVPSCQEWSSPEFEKFVANQYKLLSLSSGRLYNTCGALENRYMDLLKQLPVNENKKLFAIGPINPLKASSKINCSKTKHRCLEWLDEQEKESVIYVSFGTTTTMSEEQIKELANGLERSDQKFIWVLREADKVDIFKENNNNVTIRSGHQLPQGFEDKVKGKGLVVRDWAPQLAILGHPSIGGFLSHCGWNSCIESISMGVPIAAWPIHSDQPKNSILVTQVWKAGVVVRDWACASDEVVKSGVVEKAVRKLMASKEGQEIRARARELGVAVRGSVSSGGSSYLEMGAFVAHITR